MREAKREWRPPPLLELGIKAMEAGSSQAYFAKGFVILPLEVYNKMKKAFVCQKCREEGKV